MFFRSISRLLLATPVAFVFAQSKQMFRFRESNIHVNQPLDIVTAKTEGTCYLLTDVGWMLHRAFYYYCV